ncbi:MAG: DUF1207 domain-containing protein [Thermoguttaceae bacterium]
MTRQLLKTLCVVTVFTATALIASGQTNIRPAMPPAMSPYLPPATQLKQSSLAPCAPSLPPLVVEPCVPDLRRGASCEHWAKAPLSFWEHLFLPVGEIYPAPLADVKASRMMAAYSSDQQLGAVFDGVIGGRVGLWRYGTRQSTLPSGVQFDIEANAGLRMALDRGRDMQATDYHFGAPLTFGNPHVQFKIAYEHVSAHLGDEYILRALDEDTLFRRINYVRDSIVLGAAVRPHTDMRLYGEVSYAFCRGEMTKSWMLQFGAEYSPVYRGGSRYGSPFLAIHTTLLEELDFSGNLAVQAGWQCRGSRNQLIRLGLYYLTGNDEQLEFFDDNTSKVGVGLWYDF